MEERVLRPAGVNSTVLESPAGRHTSLSRFYERAFLGMLRLAPPVDLSCGFGATGFLSTARDLARFGMALLGGELVSPESLSHLFSTQKTVSGASTGNGLGWRISADSRGPRMSQSGRTVGGRSAIVLVPEHRLVVVILANIDGDHLDDHANRIATFFLEPE
jgi:CubicO group peptidase (beta-lactamase class C family)